MVELTEKKIQRGSGPNGNDLLYKIALGYDVKRTRGTDTTTVSVKGMSSTRRRRIIPLPGLTYYPRRG